MSGAREPGAGVRLPDRQGAPAGSLGQGPHRAPASALGLPRLHLRLTDSTNERARQLAAAGAPHGALVTASEQSAGRGRQGRRWSAPAGSSLLASIVLRPATRLLPLAAAVAVCDAVDAAPGQRGAARIKWPNDVVLEEEPQDARPAAGGARQHGALAKLAGILVEARPQQGWAVLGVGVNVAVDVRELPPELLATAATLGLRPRDIEPLLASLTTALERRLAEPAAATLAAWAERDALAGRAVAWGHPAEGAVHEEGRGVARGIDGDGRLVVEVEGGGRTALGSGEVHLLAPGGRAQPGPRPAGR